MARRPQGPVEVIAGEVDGNESQRPCERLQLADAVPLVPLRGRMVDLEDVDRGEPAHAPGPSVEAGSEDHGLGRRPLRWDPGDANKTVQINATLTQNGSQLDCNDSFTAPDNTATFPVYTFWSMTVGVGKIPYLEAEHGASLEVMKAIKHALDPENRMNPGKMIET